MSLGIAHPQKHLYGCWEGFGSSLTLSRRHCIAWWCWDVCAPLRLLQSPRRVTMVTTAPSARTLCSRLLNDVRRTMPLSSCYFSRSFFVCFLNLITHTLIYSFPFFWVIFAFHSVFVLLTCYSTHDLYKLLWLDDYTLSFILILHSHSFIRWNEDLIDFFETSDGYTLTNRFLERSLFSINTFLLRPFLARFSKVPSLVGLWREVARHFDWNESSPETLNSS